MRVRTGCAQGTVFPTMRQWLPLFPRSGTKLGSYIGLVVKLHSLLTVKKISSGKSG